MEAKCKKEAIDINGKKVMAFTKGVTYNFYESEDPEGWEAMDDNGKTETFFRLDLMFEKLPTKTTSSQP